MSMAGSIGRGLLPALAVLSCVFAGVSDARACGGCFHPQAEVGSSVVTDHRMVFKISTTETVLWDQVRYAGDPKEFAWVLPVRQGARVELSRDEWIAALDGATQSRTIGPEYFCNGPNGTAVRAPRSSSSGASSSGGGCGGATTTSSNSGADYDDATGSSSGGGEKFSNSESVEVVAQDVIGPYQAVTIRAAGVTGIREWLEDNGFAIPDAVAPTILAYTRERFDFIALRLRPGLGVRAMRPVRVVTPGADSTLPLRMVAAGVGARVGMTLWVIGEGRYHTQNFPDAVVDWSTLAWDGITNRSNRSELERTALAQGDGRAWLTEAAQRANLVTSSFGGSGSSIYDAYLDQCRFRPKRVVPCDETALPPPDGQPEDLDGGSIDLGDGGLELDAGDDAGGELDAGVSVDAGSDAGAKCTKVVSGCDGFDDLDVATRGLHAGDIWVTRLRADLPVVALGMDLRLEASPTQTEESPVREADQFTDPEFDPCAAVRAQSSSSSGSTSDFSTRSGGCTCRAADLDHASRRLGGTWVVIGLTALGVSRLVRRRRR